MTTEEILTALKKEFPEESIKEREGPKKNGQTQWFKYVPTDLLHERLDEVVGLNWTWSVLENKVITVTKTKKEYDNNYNPQQRSQPKYTTYQVEQVAVLGRLTISLPDGTQVWRDGFGGCDMGYGTQAGDPFKIADSNAFKKACYKFGLGRYLGLEALEEGPSQPNSQHTSTNNNPFSMSDAPQKQFNNRKQSQKATSGNVVNNPFA